MAHNVTHVVDGNKLVITIDIGAETIKAAPPSSTGKTLLVGTTGGSVPVAGVSYSLNVTAKR